MKSFEYIIPKNIESVPSLLSTAEGESIPFAGDTDLLSRIKEGLIAPDQLVGLKKLKELDFITENNDGVEIGAVSRLAALLGSPLLQEYTGLLEAVRSIGTPQLRNMGTVGGNLCQRPRCWYYRSHHFYCLRKGGDVCFAVSGESKYHAIMGEGPCFIVHPSDLAPMLVALNAKVTIKNPQKEYQIPLENIYVMPEDDLKHETILQPNEILTKIFIPKPAGRCHYLKFRERESFDFALASIAISAEIDGARMNKVSIVYGGIAPKPWRAKTIEKMLEGQTVTENLLRKAGEAEMQSAVTLEKNEYKTILAKNLLIMAVNDMMSR